MAPDVLKLKSKSSCGSKEVRSDAKEFEEAGVISELGPVVELMVVLKQI